jgi:hypothetical protein
VLPLLYEADFVATGDSGRERNEFSWLLTNTVLPSLALVEGSEELPK